MPGYLDEYDDDDFDSIIQQREDELDEIIYNAMSEICPDDDIDDDMVTRAKNLFCRFLGDGIGLMVYRPCRRENLDGTMREVDYPYMEDEV